MADNVSRELGEHAERLNAVEHDVRDIKKDVKEILGHVERARGGWKSMMLVGGGGITLGSVAALFLKKIGAL